jgi:hypothetical protein
MKVKGKELWNKNLPYLQENILDGLYFLIKRLT